MPWKSKEDESAYMKEYRKKRAAEARKQGNPGIKKPNIQFDVSTPKGLQQALDFLFNALLEADEPILPKCRAAAQLLNAGERLITVHAMEERMLKIESHLFGGPVLRPLED